MLTSNAVPGFYGAIMVLVYYSAGCRAPLTLTSNPSPSTTGSYCTDVGTVIFTCTGTAQGALHWVTNEIFAAEYVFPSEGSYPVPVPPIPGSPLDSPDITVTVVGARAVSIGSIVFDVVSMLTVDDISNLDNFTVRCEGNGGSESNSTLIRIEDIRKL